MSVRGIRRVTKFAVWVALAATPVAGQSVTKPKQGQGGSVVQGAAGTEGGKGDKGLEHCDKPMGAMAVVEPQNEILVALLALPAVLARRPDPHDDPAVELLHRRRARRRRCRT